MVLAVGTRAYVCAYFCAFDFPRTADEFDKNQSDWPPKNQRPRQTSRGLVIATHADAEADLRQLVIVTESVIVTAARARGWLG